MDSDISGLDRCCSTPLSNHEHILTQLNRIEQKLAYLVKATRKHTRYRELLRGPTLAKLDERLQNCDHFPKASFRQFHDKWLSTYEVDVKIDKKDFDACLVPDALNDMTSVDVLYKAIKKHGFQPRGVISAKRRKQSDGTMKYIIDDVDEAHRIYVGPPMAFAHVQAIKGPTGQTFALCKQDKIYGDWITR